MVLSTGTALPLPTPKSSIRIQVYNVLDGKLNK
jgi:hypothetical protein